MTMTPPWSYMGKEDAARSEYQEARLCILRETWATLAEDYIRSVVSDEQMTGWLGFPSTASNHIATVVRQLSTPGLYGRRPVVTCGDPAALPLIDPAGLLDRSGLWTVAQQAEYYTRGIGDLFVAASIDDGVLRWRLVWPHLVTVTVDAGRVVSMAEIRQRRGPGTPGAPSWRWAWDVYDAATGALTIREPVTGGEYGEDWTEVYGLTGLTPRPGGVPYVHRRAIDDGGTWHEHHLRGLHAGTLQGALLDTVAQRVAVFASGHAHIIGGADPTSIPGTVQTASGSMALTSVPSRSMSVIPGSATFVTVEPGSSLSHIDIGPGADLAELGMYAAQHAVRMATAAGLDVPDVMRQTANPTSGAALAVSRETRREMAAQYAEVARFDDLATLALASDVLATAGVMVPRSGYTIEYQQIPRTPTEEAERRADIEWRIGQGMMSRVDGYMALHPGATREAAVAELVRIAADNKVIATGGAGAGPSS